jgi:hypothetical protein
MQVKTFTQPCQHLISGTFGIKGTACVMAANTLESGTLFTTFDFGAAIKHFYHFSFQRRTNKY